LNLVIQIFILISFGFSEKISTPTTAVGSIPTPTPGMIFSSPGDIGKHNYSNSKGEGNGIVYTCKAGHIDLGHVRSTADWSRYAFEWIYHEILKNSDHIPFKTTVDPSIFHIEITYPDNWDVISFNSKKDIAFPAAVKLAQYVIFHAANWHEILTWHGQRKIFAFSEYASSFSWEDTFSNMMGIYLVGGVLLSRAESYNEAMTIAIQSEMDDLIMFNRNQSISITKTVEGEWYSGWIPGIIGNSTMPGILQMLHRGFDIGESDGIINPVIIKDVDDCDNNFHPGYLRPTLEEANQYGVKFYVEIEPRVSINMKILRIIHGDKAEGKMRIIPDNDIPIIMNKIKADALERGYTFYD